MSGLDWHLKSAHTCITATWLLFLSFHQVSTTTILSVHPLTVLSCDAFWSSFAPCYRSLARQAPNSRLYLARLTLSPYDLYATNVAVMGNLPKP
jgi:hypothetical protein